MKPHGLTLAFASFALLVPQVALACPSGASSCGGPMGYTTTFGVGVAAGILSVLVERVRRSRR